MTSKSSEQDVAAVRSIRNFRTNVDVENFYRFVYENDLRHEAKTLLELFCQNSKKKSPAKRKRKSRKIQ